MAELKFRLNLDTEEIELLLDEKVVDTIEKDVVQSWVTAINDKNKVPERETYVGRNGREYYSDNHAPVDGLPSDDVVVAAPVEGEPVSVDNPVVPAVPEEKE